MTRLNVLFKNFSQCRKIAQNSYATGREMGLLLTNSNLIVFKQKFTFVWDLSGIMFGFRTNGNCKHRQIAFGSTSKH